MLYITCAVVFLAGMAVGAALMKHGSNQDTIDRSTGFKEEETD